MKVPLPPNEVERLAVLRAYGILDTPPEAAFDDVTRLASRICRTPIALLTFIDGERQWFKSRVGMDATEARRDDSFCAHTILEEDVLIVPDALQDARFSGMRFASELGVRFYAGTQLVTGEGIKLGALCVMDYVPRQLDDAQLDSLRALGRQAVAQLELRRHIQRLQELLQDRGRAEQSAHRRAEVAVEQQNVLVELARMDKLDLCAALERITRADAETLGVDRVSIWFFDEALSQIVCQDMFERSHARHSRGARLDASHFPRYFAALGQQRVIAAEHARTDPNTSEFAADYLEPLGITSMLDVPIWRDGSVIGIVCHEHRGEPRPWTQAEQDFAASIADMVTLSLEAHERHRIEAELERRVAERTAELARANEALQAEVAERSRTERELIRTTSELQAIFQAFPDLYFRVDPAGVILDYNAGQETNLFRPAQESLGRRVQDVLPPEVGQIMDNALDRVNSRRMPTAFEYELPFGSELRAFEARLLPLPDDQLITIVRDITDRKKAEASLKRSEEHFRLLIENSSDIATVVDATATILYISPSVEHVLGHRQQDLLGSDALELVHAEDVPTVRATHDYLLAHPGEEISLEYRLRDGHQEWRTMGAIARTLLPDSAAAGVVINSRDITERKRAEQTLRRREEYFRSLIENGGDIIGIIDPDGIIRYDSPSVERVLGYQPAELMGSSIFAYVHPDEIEGTRRMLHDVVVSPGVGVPVELHFRHADGSYRLLEAIGKQLVLDGQLEGVVVNARDVTQRRREEEMLQRAKREAEEAREAADRANRAKSEFLSRMSHELRTPMNSILGFAQLLGKRELPQDQRKAVDHILKAGRHLLNLINEVLDIARIESNRQQLSIEPVRVRAVLQETLNLIRPLAGQHDIRIESHIAMEADHYVSADRQRLTQVLLNLLSNAAKYNNPGGTVRVSCVRADAASGHERLRIRVHDTGPGISPEKLERLFTPFERLGAEQSDVEGTGLGLALSKRLVEAMGGTLQVETEAGMGSTFSVELPLEPSPVERLAQNGGVGYRHALESGGMNATVLYVEDNLANLSLIETILAGRPEITLMSALQGQLGIELAWQHGPDLILLDLHLPDMSGDDVLRRLRADPRTRETPVIIISADATAGRTQRLLDAGADAYMTKPLDVDDFLATVDRLLTGAGGARA